MKRKRIMYIIIGIIVVLGLLWTFAAVKAGLFITDSHRLASNPDEESMDLFSKKKKFIDVDSWRVAYIDEGSGDPVLLLHGCPFHAYDLLGLGDTVVRLDDDYRLPNQMKMVVGLMDRLGIESARIVGHDHGGATAQLMMKYHPARIQSLVLTNVEAYDQWPSEPERTDLELIVSPVSTPLFRVMIGFTAIQRHVFSIAVHNKQSLTDEALAAYMRPHIASPERWYRLRRFFRWQLDREHNLETLRAVDGIQRFDRPTLLLWGKHDTNFGPAIAERLAKDIPGFIRIELLENSAHMPMQEEPEAYARAVLRFFGEGQGNKAKENR